MCFYSDETRTYCVAQFRRIQVVTPVTVQTMSLAAFKKMLNHCDYVEFTCHKIYYNFMREADGVKIYRGHGYREFVYRAATTDVDDIVNAKFLPDGKSIAEVPNEIEL